MAAWDRPHVCRGIWAADVARLLDDSLREESRRSKRRRSPADRERTGRREFHAGAGISASPPSGSVRRSGGGTRSGAPRAQLAFAT